MVCEVTAEHSGFVVVALVNVGLLIDPKSPRSNCRKLYLSPEAITGRDLDGRSDLYALGAVGYYLLTGEPVFSATSIVEVSAHHLHSVPVPPSERSPRPVPADLEAVLLRCLAKAPGDRYPSGQALQQALVRCAEDSPWSLDAALQWWDAFRSSRPESEQLA